MTTDTLMQSETLIQVRDLEKHFSDTIHALNGVSTDIRRGEVLVVIGPSGSGKSTFLRCLNLLEVPTAGTITFEGVNITDPKVNINLHRQKMGMVFQHFNLFPNMTVMRNLTIAPVELRKKSKADAEKLAMTLLERVDFRAEVLLQVPHLNERISGHCCAASSPVCLPAS